MMATIGFKNIAAEYPSAAEWGELAELLLSFCVDTNVLIGDPHLSCPKTRADRRVIRAPELPEKISATRLPSGTIVLDLVEDEEI